MALRAATVPAGFTETIIASGLASPTAMQIAPDGRLFVCEQGGRLRVIKGGVLLPTPFLTVTVNATGERGLLGVAFDPEFARNGHVYIYYTATTPTVHNRISRFTASGDTAVAGSEVVLLELDSLSSATNHNGGAMAFGPDGKLYAGVGDNANGAHAQSLSTLHGKMLRIEKDGSIPTDNPFHSSASGKNRAIWAMGLRNPFTFGFHRDGRLFINDVGQNVWEEINNGIPGANYGWPETEGPTTEPRFVSPVYAYDHSGGACAITGGAFYSPMSWQFPSDYLNDYFFADYCAGWIRKLDPASGNSVTTFATGISAPVDLKVADDGSLYYLARGLGSGTGIVAQIKYSAAPAISTHPSSQTVAPGSSVTFSVRATGAPPLRYQWQRNGTDILGATVQDYTIGSVTVSDDKARFRAVVRNDDGSAVSNEAVLTVSGNQPPTATITQPVAGTTYAGGMVINYAGTGTDPEDGTLGPAAFTWRVDFHHDTHTHPFIAPTSGATSGSFTIPTTGETSANVWYRIYLTVRDAAGATHTAFREVLPRKVRLTLATSPIALQLRLDGQPVTVPYSFDSVVGIVRNLEAVTPQSSGGTSHEFASWSDGGAATHNISTPSTATTYTATYRAIAVAANGLTGTYFDNIDFTGTTLARVDATVDFNWGASSPATLIGADTFSVRWTGQVMPQYSETYTFFTVSDDGVRLWVNGRPIIDNWTDHAATENSGTIALAGGQRYDIRMEFYERGGQAVARLLWSSPSTPKAVVPNARLFPSANGLTGTYFDNIDFTITTLTRVDATVDFNWGAGSPAGGMGADTFSVRWTGQVMPQYSETYTFYTVSDDGVRLWVNGRQIVDNWTDHAATENSGTIALTGGQRYDIRMEFYERGGEAAARLLWSSPSTPKAVIPTARLFPGAASVAIRVNFQPSSAPIPTGYLMDAGLVYGDRGNGFTYGWAVDNTAYARDRNAAHSPDQRHDTLTHMQWPSNRDAIWEIAVPNGTYSVRIIAGDPNYIDSIHRISAEGVLVVNAAPTSSARWVEGTGTIQVSDGRLTLGNHAGASNNKICFVEVTRQ